MALTVDKLMNEDRFSGDNFLHFLLYMPFGVILLVLRTLLGLLLWVASILLPNKWALRQVLSTIACWTFGVYVKVKGSRDPRCSVMVSNYVSCLDSLAVSHVFGTITLRKWKVPPFFASTLGIVNEAQFARKQHFAECPSKPVLLQPEGGPTNGKGLLKFTDWPFQMGNRVQPVAITAERPFASITVHGPTASRVRFPWADALWFMWAPATAIHVRALPPLERDGDTDVEFIRRIQEAIAQALGVEASSFSWEQLRGGRRAPPPAGRRAAPDVWRLAAGPRAAPDVWRLARQVKDVLPRVPLAVITRDLAVTRSVDLTITNLLEGAVPYDPEPEPDVPDAPRYVIPVPTGVFPKSAKERQLSFQEKKAQMIAEARQRYIEKHNLDVPAC